MVKRRARKYAEVAEPASAAVMRTLKVAIGPNTLVIGVASIPNNNSLVLDSTLIP